MPHGCYQAMDWLHNAAPDLDGISSATSVQGHMFNHAGNVDVVIDLIGHYTGTDGSHHMDMNGGQ